MYDPSFLDRLGSPDERDVEDPHPFAFKSKAIMERARKEGWPVLELQLTDAAADDYSGVPIPIREPGRTLWNIATDRAINAEILRLHPGHETCGMNSNGEFWGNPDFVANLSEREKKQLADHEKMHLKYAHGLSSEQRAAAEAKIDAYFSAPMIAEPGWLEWASKNSSPLFIDELNKTSPEVQAEIDRMMQPRIEKAIATTRSVNRVEGPCYQCTRNNDIGSKKCWWCEVPDPTKLT